MLAYVYSILSHYGISVEVHVYIPFAHRLHGITTWNDQEKNTYTHLHPTFLQKKNWVA